MSDPMDDLLTDQGRRWRDALDADPAVPLFDDGSGPHRRSLLLGVPLVAVLVLVLAAAIGLLAARPDQTAATGPAGCATGFQAPTDGTAASLVQVNRVRVTLVYRGSKSCVVRPGRPSVVLLDSHGRVLARGARGEGAALVVPPGAVFTFNVGFGFACSRVTSLRVHVDGSADRGGVSSTLDTLLPVSCRNLIPDPSMVESVGVGQPKVTTSIASSP